MNHLVKSNLGRVARAIACLGIANLSACGGQANPASARAVNPGGAVAATVASGPPSDLIFVSGDNQTGSVGSVLPAPLVVRVVDLGGVGVSGVTVSWAANPDGVVTPATSTTDAGGYASTTARLPTTSGPASFSASCPALPGSAVAFSAVASPGQAVKLALGSQPIDTFAGRVFDPITVEEQDSFGNLIPDGAVSIAVRLVQTGGGVVLKGTLSQTAVAGSATFSNLSIERAATGLQLVFSSPGLASATSAPFAVSPAPATALAIEVQPSPVFEGEAMAPAVVVTTIDQFGNVSESYDTITLTLSPGQPGSLTGTVDAPAIGGRATFPGLFVAPPGVGYRLAAQSSLLLPGAVSSPFNVGPRRWLAAGSPANARDYHSATGLNDGKVLLAGGHNWTGELASSELYDPVTDAFSPAGTLSSTRRNHTATRLPNGKVLIAGGATSIGAPPWTVFLASTELYDPATNTFGPAGAMISDRAFHTATLLRNGKVLIAGGMGTSGTTATAELYDPGTDRFSPIPPMGAARASPSATLLSNGKVLIAGGRAAAVLASAELYDPASNTFSPAGPMSAPRVEFPATLLPSGKVLITGGDRAELYDPATNAFSPAASPIRARRGHTATLLPGGRVLIAGGADRYEVASAELYDPQANVFIPAGEMRFPRVTSTATLLSDGRVLVAGGSDSEGIVTLATAELFRDATVP